MQILFSSFSLSRLRPATPRTHKTDEARRSLLTCASQLLSYRVYTTSMMSINKNSDDSREQARRLAKILKTETTTTTRLCLERKHARSLSTSPFWRCCLASSTLSTIYLRPMLHVLYTTYLSSACVSERKCASSACMLCRQMCACREAAHKTRTAKESAIVVCTMHL